MNEGGIKSTAKRKPFVIIHFEQFESKTEALKRENYLKSPEGTFKLKEYLRSIGILNNSNMILMK